MPTLATCVAIRSQRLLLVLIGGVLLGCSSATLETTAVRQAEGASDAESTRELAVSVALASPVTGSADPSETLFEKLSPEMTGVDFRHLWRPRNDYESQMLKTGFTGGGVCLGDYDADGLCDVFLTRPHGGARLFRNLGGFRFKDVTVVAGLADEDGWSTGATFVDVDNDGRLDLVVCGHRSPTRLYLNQGNGTFIEAARRVGLGFNGAGVKAVFADYDRDGDLDAFLATNRLEPRKPPKIRYLGKPGAYTVAPEHQELVGVINLPDGRQQFTKAGQFDHLYQNQLAESGELKFTDVSKRAGIDGNFHGLDAIWWDSNADGYPDLYVANDFTDPDQLYRNNGDGTFTDVTLESLPNTPWFAMGAAAGDLNGDGLFDLLATDMAGTTHYREKMAMGSMDSIAWFLDTAEPRQYMRNALYLNSGTERFLEVAHMAGLASSNWTWSVKIVDLDLDGREDVFVTNGFTRDYLNSDFNERLKQAGRGQDSLAWYDAPELKEPNMAFRNLGDVRFEDVSAAWGLDEIGIAFGCAIGDLDNDGDPDIVTSNFDGPPSFFRNRAVDGHRLKVRLVDGKENRQGVGAIVRIKTPAGDQIRRVNCGSGFMSSDEPVVYFGLGDEERVERLTVAWPDGSEQEHTGLDADREYTITKGAAESGAGVATAGTVEPLFSRSADRIATRHEETPFDDFAAQPLLPAKLSQLGPGLAMSDVNVDGLQDLYLGGAAGQPGRLMLGAGEGGFRPAEVPDFDTDRAHEDMGCLFFDIDSDGDLDLYVVSGSVEFGEDDPALQDRLYLNESDGSTVVFRRAAERVPDFRDSGGVVAGADFDRDGDVDLFVGGRVVPGRYPVAPQSRLLRNDDGRLVDATADVAAGLVSPGMVTSAIWSDVDNDGWIDLLVTLDYGPIKLFKNEAGRLVDATVDAQLSGRTGWWNSIAARDVDLDGDVDFAVTNLGLNTKYHPSPASPQLLYYGDFEGAGKFRLVEAKTGSAGVLPVRGRSCSSNAMPFLKEKFGTYHAFASASLVDIYTEPCLDESLQLEVTTAEYGLLLNDGAGRFEFRELPRLAQAAPGFGIQFLHANDDVYPDLFIAQNFYTPQRETGRMNGGLGTLLLGSADASFTATPASESGVVLPTDATGAIAHDLNRDGWDDLIVANNDESVATLVRSAELNQDRLTLLLKGAPGNPTAIGARVTVARANGAEAIEVHAGEGYLTQGSGILRLSKVASNPIKSVTVRWPDGSETAHDIATEQTSVALAPAS